MNWFYILIAALYLGSMLRYVHEPKMALLSLGLAFVSIVQSTFGG